MWKLYKCSEIENNHYIYPTPSLSITENNAMPTPSPDIVIISTNCRRFLKYKPNMRADDSRTMAAPMPTTIPVANNNIRISYICRKYEPFIEWKSFKFIYGIEYFRKLGVCSIWLMPNVSAWLSFFFSIDRKMVSVWMREKLKRNCSYTTGHVSSRWAQQN